jgi:hypothetical protein
MFWLGLKKVLNVKSHNKPIEQARLAGREKEKGKFLLNFLNY